MRAFAWASAERLWSAAGSGLSFRALAQPGLAVQPLRPMGLRRLGPVVQGFARYPKLAGHRQNAFAPFGTLDRRQFERHRELTVLSSCYHRSSSK
jgi:hypothetical protein